MSGEVEFGVSVTGGALSDYSKKLTLTVDGYPSVILPSVTNLLK